MFKFLFGLAWTAFITPMFILCLVVPGEQRGGADMDLFLFSFFILFEAIGLYMLISGLRKIIKDIKTKMHGIKCYGIVSDIQVTGSYVNGKPEYKVILDFVNPETNQLETIEEIIGFNYNKYPIDSYVQCKYYQGDINLEDRVSENEIPEEIKKYLVSGQQEPNDSNLEFSADREYVTIDGVQYKKISRIIRHNWND